METTKKSDEVSESIQTESILDSSHTNITSKHHNHSIKTIIKGEDIKIDKSTDSEIITVTKDEGKHFVNFAQDKTELKFKYISNHGGGDCFFYSISEDGQTNNRAEFIQEIKKRLSEEIYKKMIVGEIAGMIETVTAITEFTGTNLSWLGYKKGILEKYKEKLQIQNKKYEYENEFEILDLIALINDQKGQKKRKPTKTIEELETDLAKKTGKSIAWQQAIETEIANKTGKSIEEIKQEHCIFV